MISNFFVTREGCCEETESKDTYTNGEAIVTWSDWAHITTLLIKIKQKRKASKMEKSKSY